MVTASTRYARPLICCARCLTRFPPSARPLYWPSSRRTQKPERCLHSPVEWPGIGGRTQARSARTDPVDTDIVVKEARRALAFDLAAGEVAGMNLLALAEITSRDRLFKENARE